MRLDEIVKVFGGSDGGATKAMYDQLEAIGHAEAGVKLAATSGMDREKEKRG